MPCRAAGCLELGLPAGLLRPGMGHASLVTRLYLCILWGLAAHASFLSQTLEYAKETSSWDLCPNSDKDLQRTGVANFTEYRRQHRLPHSLHKRLMDLGEHNEEQRHHSSRLDKIYEYPVSVPSLVIQSGISNLGETRRLERALNKLIAGQPIRVGALGGSVTVGHNIQNKQLSWVNRIFNWIETAFPHPDHVFINKAIPAVTSAYVAPCVLDLIPHDLDLIFLEFTFNDGERALSENFEDPTRLGLERLIRKLLNMDSRPAVINLHYHPFYVYPHYWSSSEDTMGMLFRYYGVTSISVRTALHRLLADQQWLLEKLWYKDDPVHPTCIGHKFIADLIIGLMQDMAAHMLSTSCCHAVHGSHSEALYNKLPPPLLGLATASYGEERCYMDETFQALENGNNGWSWVDEGRQADQHKRGFISWKPGQSIVLQVPVKELAPHIANRTLMIALGVMTSYEHMGWLSFSCVNGCKCKERQVNSHSPTRYSLTYWKAVNATLLPDSTSCELYVENRNRTRSGEHKVKITSLLVSPETSTFIESWTFED